MDEPPGGAPADGGHLERRHDELRFHPLGHRPADDRPRVAVDHRGQVEAALAGGDLADVGEPELVGAVGPKAAADQVRGGAHALQADRRPPAPAPAHGAPEARLCHLALDPLSRDADALATQLGVHARRAVAAPAIRVDRMDQLEQADVRDPAPGRPAPKPGVEARARDPEHPAHERDWVGCPLRGDEPEHGYRLSLSLAKKAARLF